MRASGTYTAPVAGPPARMGVRPACGHGGHPWGVRRRRMERLAQLARHNYAAMLGSCYRRTLPAHGHYLPLRPHP
eukprot:1327837-Prorocentrum_lima.AAC.1